MKETKDTTRRRVTENVRRLVQLTNAPRVPVDQAGDYMAYYNIFYGLEKKEKTR